MMRISFNIILLLFSLILFFSCNKEQKYSEHKQDSTKIDNKIEEYYTCPMHPQIVQDHFGTCPICNMDLVKKQKQIKSQSVNEEYYTCPMHPEIISKEPGICPICKMDLVKKIKSSQNSPGAQNLSEVILSRSQIESLNIGITRVEEKECLKEIDAYGIVEISEKNQYIISAKVKGRVEKLFKNSTGQFIKKGEPLYEIYSPDLITTVEEYLNAVNNNFDKIIESSKNRLLQWGLTENQIIELKKNNKIPDIITILSPFSGIVMKKNIIEGQYINEGSELYNISDLSTLWVKTRFNETDLEIIKPGKRIDIFSEALPGTIFKGKIDFIYPEIDQSNRTILARSEIDNSKLVLKPGMYVKVKLLYESYKTPVIPSTSVFDNGTDKIVWIQQEEGKYIPRNIKIGNKVKIRDENISYFPVLDGLSIGDYVVTSAGYLIDSESRIKAQGE
jgi:membrane fusion protein, copper/silver efflux system